MTGARTRLQYSVRRSFSFRYLGYPLALISEASILEVKRAVDITEVVRGYLPNLKKAGANFKTLCPFHEEKTPSFNVHPEKGIYKCFGCGKAGDAIDFVREFEKCDYPEAIQVLAEKCGIPLKYDERGGGPAGPRKEDLYRVNEWAAGFFRRLLASDAAAHARAYVIRRGVTPETEETFRLGWAPAGWDGLLSAARKHGFNDDLLLAAGLVVARDGGGVYDRFRNRLMFPIADARGKVIAFGGRALSDEDNPKYLNTSETALFAKGRNFYALDLQKDELEKSRTIHIVEGYFDVILPYQHGVRGLVATLGTALTRDHLKVLRRYVESVVLVFDGDAAGRRANERGLDLLLGEDMDLYVAGLPADEDPCDVVVAHGADRLRACLAQRREIFDFLAESIRAKHGSGTTAASARIVDDILERVAQIPDPIKVEVLVRRVGELFKMDERAVRAALRRKASPAAAEEAAPGEEAPSREEAVGRELLALMVARPELAERVRQSVPLSKYPGVVARKVAERAYGDPSLAGGDLLALLTDPAQRQMLAGLIGKEMEPREAERTLKQCLEYVREGEFKSAAGGLRAERNLEEFQKLLREKQRQPIITRRLPGH